MEKYECLNEVGSGSYGNVFRAVDKESGEVVAVKRIKSMCYSWEECLNLPEVKSLQRLRNHPNIIRLKEVVRENNILYFIFEFMERNLYQVMAERGSKLFSEVEVKNWLFQVFQGLAYMHKQGYFHRDLKPENLLVTGNRVKIADLGFAKEIMSSPPFSPQVMTLWYRAPEVLLQSYAYDSSIDMWSMGAIMAELFTFKPLFPGKNEFYQMYKICEIIGSPTEECWAGGVELARYHGYKFPELGGINLSLLIPNASKEAVSLIKSLCSWNPCNRPSAAQALQHPFFQGCFCIPHLYLPPASNKTSICWNKNKTEATNCPVF